MRLRKANWNLDLPIDEANKRNEIVPIAESSVIRFIDIENGIDTKELYLESDKIDKEIKKLKKLPTTVENRNAIKLAYNDKYNKLFIKDYVCIVMDSISDFNRLNRKAGFFINGIKYKRLLGTSGGIKKNVVVYVNVNLYDNIEKRINNGRDMTKEFVPAKLEAYKALSCSASVPVSVPKGVLVVDDCVTHFNSRVIKIDDTQSDYPIQTVEDNYPIDLIDSDGYGLISPTLSMKWAEDLGEQYVISGFCIRNSFCKGMVFTFDFEMFAKEVCDESYIVKDIWGNSVDVRNVDLVLTASMLKLWDSYKDIDHYLACCNENDYTFSVTKTAPEILENQRSTNYQFLQSLYLTDDMISRLVNPTIEMLRDVLGFDYRKTLLFLKGSHLDEMDFNHEDCDFAKALMIDKRMINDPFVKSKIHNMIRKRINQAKIGVLNVRANYSIISGDPYSLCQHIFGKPVTGLLKAGEFYSKYWSEKGVDKVACFRAPMTCHNNIRILNIRTSEDMKKWYKYMTTVTIFNSWDTTTHALNGADKDSDSVFTTDNKEIMESVRPTDAIFCVQKTANKLTPTQNDLSKSNKDGFGDQIGVVTNHITSMFDVLANYDENSKEYSTLMYRIMCGQNYQQNAIDKIKGIVAKKMPKFWYDNRANKIKEGDSSEVVIQKQFNQRIVSDKQPYFFKYIYPHRMKAYNKHLDKANKNCLMRFGIPLSELLIKSNRTNEEEEFVKWYFIKMPLSISKSVMNKICWLVEGEFDNLKSNSYSNDFDYSILMSDKPYTKGRYNAIKKLYSDYNKTLKEQSQIFSLKKVDKEERKTLRKMFKHQFKIKASELCSDAEELCNIVIKLCYNNNNSKQFAWDVCGDTIIQNLLKNNEYKVSYPVPDSMGDIVFDGERFSMITEEVVNEDNIR
jgi:hypothetical protein